MTTYTKTAGSVKNVTKSSSVGAWSNGGATWNSPSEGVTNQFTDYLCYYNFGFSIPSNEVIVGITVNYGAQNSPNTTETACDNSVVLTTNASSQIGGSVDHATATAYNNASQTTQTRGGTSDTWSSSLTYTQANSSNFGFMVSSKMKTYGASAPFNTSQFLSSTPTIVITTTVVSPPSAPTSLTSNVSGSTVVLNWTASSGATAYNVYRGSTSGSETLYASGIGATTYTDLGVASGRTYFYYVTATNTAGGSSASNEVSAVLKPDPPTGVTATGRTTSIAVAWAASSGATGYNVYRSTTSGSGYTGLGTGISTLSYVDSTALDGVMYYYVVKASNSGGTSGYSSEASAKTTKSSATKILVGFPGGIRRL